MKCVFDTRAGSGYDDDVATRYHFPNRYLAEAQRAVGDWVVYREPRRGGGREGYVAVARMDRIVPDPARAGFSYAYMQDYLPFDVVVPLRFGAGFHEALLSAVANPSRIGPAMRGRSIRGLSDTEFAGIVRAGLGITLDPGSAVRLGLAGTAAAVQVGELLDAPPDEQERRIEQILVNRKIRDAAFRQAVVSAYGERCAVTRLRIINGGGKAEVQAAHMLPVADGGPDIVQNGIALSGTVHWLFDRHLISLTDNFELLVAHNRVPAELRALFTDATRRIHLPDARRLWPHPKYVRLHRERFASGGYDAVP